MQQIPHLKRKNHVLHHILDLAAVLIIILVGWVYTYNIEQVLDIGLYDETSYLHRGILIPNGFPNPQNAPLYSLWYYVLSFVQHDTVELYFLNFKVMTVLPALMLFLALRAYRVSRILCFVISLGVLFSSSNFPTWPKVSHFAVVLLLFGFFTSSFFRDRRIQACALAIAALFVSYVRPEFFLTFILLIFVLVFDTLVTLRATRSLRTTIPFVATLIPALILILWLGLPIASGNRAMVAFGQHYALNWVRWHNAELNPWTNWKTIVAGDFGDADSPREALLKNPSAMAHHIVHNLRTWPRVIKSMFGSSFPPSYTTNLAFRLGLFLIAALGIAHIRQQGITASRDRLVENWKHLWFRAVLLLIVLLPAVISILLISPRRHYLYILGIMLAFGLAVFLFYKTDQYGRHSSYSILALLCIVPLLTTRPLTESIEASPQPNLSTINFLRSLDIEVPIDILESEGGYGVYVGENYTRVAEHDKTTTFGDFLTEKSLDMVIVTDRLSRDVRFRADAEWLSFINDPSHFGFVRMPIPDIEQRSLFVRKEVVNVKRKQDVRLVE